MKNDEIGARIKERREELNVSASSLADWCGLSKATIHRYENGSIKQIKLAVISEIAEKLNVNPAWLIGKSDSKDENKIRLSDDIQFMLDSTIAAIQSGRPLRYGNKVLDENDKRRLLSTIETAKNIME